MRDAIRSAGIALIAIVSALFLAIATSMMTAQAATVLMLGGIAAGKLPDLVMSTVLGGRYANDTRVNVEWPAQARPYTGPNSLTLGESITQGVTSLSSTLDAIKNDPSHDPNEPVTIVGMSAGALVVDEYIRAHPNGTPGLTLKLVIVADSSRQDVINGTQQNSEYGYTYQPPPETNYEITVVTGEYDGAADFPDRVWNVLAVANAMAGALYVHVPVMFANLDQVPAKNITVTTNPLGGVTTHYLVPAAHLPLVQMLPFLALFEGVLKPIVDSGYSRNDSVAAMSLAAAGLATETQTESSRQAVEPPVGSLTEPETTAAEQAGQELTKTSEATDNETTTANETTEEPAQAALRLEPATDAVANGASDPTDNTVTPSTTGGPRRHLSGGNMVSPSTTGGPHRRHAGGGGNTPRTSTTTGTQTSDTSPTKGSDPSGTQGSDPSSSTSSSSDEDSTK